MFKIIIALLVFIRELIFDSKDEYNFASRKFSIKKTAVYAAIVFSFVCNVFLTGRLYAMAVKSIATKKEIEAHAKEDERKALERAKEKISKRVPSDSGNSKSSSRIIIPKDSPTIIDSLSEEEKKALYDHLKKNEDKE